MALQKPTLDIFSGTENMGTVISEQQQVNIKFTEFNIPLTGEAGNTAVDWKGKTRVIVIQAYHDGEGFAGADDNAKLAQFIGILENWIQGDGQLLSLQQSAVYVDSFGDNHTVKGFDWTWTRSFSDPYRINYSLLLKVV